MNIVFMTCENGESTYEKLMFTIKQAYLVIYTIL